MTSKYHEIDPAELSSLSQQALATYREAYKAMKKAREEFEDCARVDLPKLPEGKQFAFGYNFGKLSVTIVDASERKAAPKNKGSLAEWMQAQVANGDRT